MILIPQRLFNEPSVKIILKDGNVCILEKKLDSSITNREGYVSSHVISIVLSGEQHIRTIDNTLIKIKKNEIVFIPRGLYHVSDLITQDKQFRSVLFYFDNNLIERFLSTNSVNKVSNEKTPNHLKFGVLPSIQLFVESFIHIYQSPKLQNRNSLEIKILELLHLLNGLSPKQQFTDFLFRLTLPKKRNIKTFMDNNFDKPLKIGDYAYLTGRSTNTFRRDFKASFQITPQKWLKKKRIEKALLLSNTKELSVSELAFEVGYENVSYFIKSFKAEVGLSPKQYFLNKKS